MTGTVVQSGNLFASAGRLLNVADGVQLYRLSKPGLTAIQISDLNVYEGQLRDQALKVAKKVADDILSTLKNEIDKIKTSTSSVRQDLDNLEDFKDVIQGITEIIKLAGNIIRLI